MLTQPLLAGLAGIALSLSGAPPLPAAVVCPPRSQICFVDAETPGQPAPTPVPAESASSSEPRVCTIELTGATVDCVSPIWGWFSSRDSCYYKLRVPPPPATDSLWEGHYPDGGIYVVTCLASLGGPGTNGGWVWLATPPDGYGAASITPGELAARAVDQMQLTGAVIGMTPGPGRTGLVGVPVWLWTEVTPTSWGPNSATATVPGLSVTATAQASKIVWDMGDGATVTCANPGTAYYKGAITSPTCQHIYERSSAGQPDDAYPVTATTTWDVTWTGGGASGALTLTRASSSTVRIGELQVLVTS